MMRKRDLFEELTEGFDALAGIKGCVPFNAE
jgi:hypothetical protein